MAARTKLRDSPVDLMTYFRGNYLAKTIRSTNYHSQAYFSISFTQGKYIYNRLITISHWTAMTNAYTARDPRDAQGILIQTTPLESSSPNSGSHWQLFLLGVVALKRVQTRMHNHSRGQASAELGENPNRDSVSHFSRQPGQ